MLRNPDHSDSGCLYSKNSLIGEIMADFQYIAINREGREIKGSMEAKDEFAVRAKLKLDGLTPVTVKVQSFLTKDISFGSGKVKTRDLSVFCRQFASILNAGVSIVDALRMLGEQTESKVLKKAITVTRDQVQQGESLAGAMSKSPKVFPAMFINMVDAGEQSGSLDIAVSRMGKHFEKSAKLSGMIKSAMIYPIAVIVIALAVTIIMSVAVVPKFAEMFSGMGAELPASTRMVMAFSNLLINRWWLMLIIIAALILLLKYFGTTVIGKRHYGTLALKLPIFGKLNMKTNCANFSRTLSTLVSSGMGITTALEICGRAMKNQLYKDAVIKCKSDVEQGIPLSVPIRKNWIFPSMVHNMVAIGEETGSVEQMLDKVADYYEEEAEMATKNMTELMQPIIIVVLGIIIAVLVLAMYQPMIGMYQNVGSL